MAICIQENNNSYLSKIRFKMYSGERLISTLSCRDLIDVKNLQSTVSDLGLHYLRNPTVIDELRDLTDT